MLLSMIERVNFYRAPGIWSQQMRGSDWRVFANIRHHKRITRFNHRGRAKVNTQWNLYFMVHNIEKLATKTTIGRQARCS